MMSLLGTSLISIQEGRTLLSSSPVIPKV